jgi:hypothetical protein
MAQDLSTFVYPLAEETFAEGRAALVRLKSDRTHDDWRAVATVMLLFTVDASRELGRIGRPDHEDTAVTKLSNKKFRAWEQEGGSNLHPLSKQELWALRELTFNPEIEDFYLREPPERRRKLNHPNAIINAHKRSLTLKEKLAAASDEQPDTTLERMRSGEIQPLLDAVTERLRAMSPEQRGRVRSVHISDEEGDELKSKLSKLEVLEDIFSSPPVRAALEAWSESDDAELVVIRKEEVEP